MTSAPELRSLVAVVTARCNLACSYCFQNTRRPRRMSWETLSAAVDRLLRSPLDRVSLTFSGGEPLLELPLVRRAVERVDQRRRPDQSVLFRLFTNGTLLTSRTAAFLAANDVAVQLSFDGIPAAQALRGRGTFDLLDRLIEHLRTEHPGWFRERFSVAVTLLPSTLATLTETVRYFLGKRVGEIGISPAVTGISAWRPQQFEELESSFGPLFDLCLEHYEQTGRVPVDLFRRIDGEAAPLPEGGALCGAPSTSALTVDADGRVYGCPLFAESYQRLPGPLLADRLPLARLGSVRSAGLDRRLAAYPEAVRRTGLFHHKESQYSSFGRCRDCEHLRSCRICPVAIGHLSDNTDPHRVPDFLCAFNRVSLEHRRRFPALPDPVDVLRGRQRVPRSLQRLRELVESGNQASRP